MNQPDQIPALNYVKFFFNTDEPLIADDPLVAGIYEKYLESFKPEDFSHA